MNLETIFNPSEKAVEPIERGLHEFNRVHLGDEILNNFHRLLVIAKEDTEAILGGAYGFIIWEWMHLETLWVAERHRRKGLGRQLLSQIEIEAAQKGARGCHLETTDFQALDFYRKSGYLVLGEIEDKPLGHTWYYLKKLLL